MFGWFAWVWSFFGLDFFGDRYNVSFGWIFGPITIPLSYPIACTIGAAANLAYLIALAAYWFARRKPPAHHALPSSRHVLHHAGSPRRHPTLHQRRAHRPLPRLRPVGRELSGSRAGHATEYYSLRHCQWAWLKFFRAESIIDRGGAHV